jgi:PKD repeat protein
LPEPRPAADADFGYDPEQPTVTNNRNTVFFTDASGGEIVAWQWDFGNPASGAANTSAERSPEHIYATPGVYRVTLKVTDDRGTTDSTQQVLEVGP